MSDSVTVTTRVAVDPVTAFRVFTDDVDRWWKRGARWRFGDERDGTLAFESTGDERALVETYADRSRYVVGRVTTWSPGERLAFEFRGRELAGDERTLVEVHFDEEEGDTRVTLVHRGWDSLPPDHPARRGLVGGSFRAAIGGWWSMHLVGFGSTVAARS